LTNQNHGWQVNPYASFVLISLAALVVVATGGIVLAAMGGVSSLQPKPPEAPAAVAPQQCSPAERAAGKCQASPVPEDPEEDNTVCLRLRLGERLQAWRGFRKACKKKARLHERLSNMPVLQ